MHALHFQFARRRHETKRKGVNLLEERRTILRHNSPAETDLRRETKIII